MVVWWRLSGAKIWVWKYSFREVDVTRSIKVPAQSTPTWKELVVGEGVEGCGETERRRPSLCLAQRSGVGLGLHLDGSRVRQCRLVGRRVGRFH